MSERKVLNKYFPPEYDPEKFPTLGRSSKSSGTVRLMAPFSMRCLTCGEFIYKSKKFNARKENTDEFYLSIQILRFYIRCPKCAAEITFKTDPKNTDYEIENGASRNYEPWKEERQQHLHAKLKREQEEDANPLKALENKTLDSKKEIELFEALDEIRAVNDRNYKFNPDSVMSILYGSDKEENVPELEKAEKFLEEQSTFITTTGKRPLTIDEDPATNEFIRSLFKKHHSSKNNHSASDEEGKSIISPSKPLKEENTKHLLPTSTAQHSNYKPKISGIIIKKKAPSDAKH